MAKLLVQLPNGSPISYEITDDRTTIGRLPDNDLQIEDGSVSSHHAEIILEGDALLLCDLGSTNGTSVNGSPITEWMLNEGDAVLFGNILATFSTELGEEKNYTEVDEQVIVASTVSAKPIDFASTSPFPKVDLHKDPVRSAAYLVSGVSLVLIVVSLLSTFALMNVPDFPVP